MSTTASLYRQVMGNDFDMLAEELRIFHSIYGKCRLAGRCKVTGPETLIGRIVGRIFSLPKTTEDTVLEFELDADAGREIWQRHFPGRLMLSQMRAMKGALVERLGPVDLHFHLKAQNGRLAMQLKKVSLAGVPCPRFLVPVVVAEEFATPGKLHFNVAARLPVIGLLVAYQGFLHLGLNEEKTS